MDGDYIQACLKSLCGGGTTMVYIMILQLNPICTRFVGLYLHIFHSTSKIYALKYEAVPKQILPSLLLLIYCVYMRQNREYMYSDLLNNTPHQHIVLPYLELI